MIVESKLLKSIGFLVPHYWAVETGIGEDLKVVTTENGIDRASVYIS